MEQSRKAETKANYKPKLCPLTVPYPECGSRCAWFNEENQHCIIWEIHKDLECLNGTLFDIEAGVRQ